MVVPRQTRPDKMYVLGVAYVGGAASRPDLKCMLEIDADAIVTTWRCYGADWKPAAAPSPVIQGFAPSADYM